MPEPAMRWLLVETGFGGLIALLATALGSRHRRLGHMAADTIVVRNDPADSTVGSARPP